jgi:Vitamin B6 photo-protection and homoeostasis
VSPTFNDVRVSVLSPREAILFAWRIGTALEPEAKRYRLLADIFNDGAMILDCLSPALPKHIRLFSLCVSGSLRALCGVAAGGAKAALSVHFARANNIGDLNAKDSSQETVIGLLGMLVSQSALTHSISEIVTAGRLLRCIPSDHTSSHLVPSPASFGRPPFHELSGSPCCRYDFIEPTAGKYRVFPFSRNEKSPISCPSSEDGTHFRSR